MNLNQLKIFYVAAKYGSLTRAAKALFVTQPAVTKGIQKLQNHYDIKLFNRIGKKLILTDAGEALFDIAENIFHLENKAEDRIRDFLEQKRGRIRIYASESFGAYYLPDIMNPFCRKNPFIRMSVTILPNQQVVENTADLACDLGFISYPIIHPKVLIKEVLKDRLVFIFHPGHPLAGREKLLARDLEKQPMIVHEKGSAPYRILNDYFTKKNRSLSITLELSSNRAIKKAVESGLGIALISRMVAEEEIAAGRLVAIAPSDPAITRKFYLVHHREKYISKTLQGFIDQVARWAKQYASGIL